jgi:hypothetical protein
VNRIRVLNFLSRTALILALLVVLAVIAWVAFIVLGLWIYGPVP